MQKPRIIFDRSAFHGDAFDGLVRSSLLAKSKARRISIYHTASLIEETASLYLKERHRPMLRKQLPFIIKICNDRWLQPTEVIWTKELVERVDTKQCVFMQEKDRENMEALLLRMASENWIDPADMDTIRHEKDSVKQRSKRLRQTLVKMRDQAGEKRLPPSFQEFARKNMEEFGTGILIRHLNTADRESASQIWVGDKDRYPYFTAFTKGMLYAAYYAMTKSNERIDKNTQMDVEQLAYLHGVDILVSNDFRFMKDAFDVLWLPQGKQYMSTDRFITYLESL